MLQELSDSVEIQGEIHQNMMATRAFLSDQQMAIQILSFYYCKQTPGHETPILGH